MIVSREHRFVFVEAPFTGSTAISKELLEQYGCEEVLHKHAHLREFLNVATPEEREYKVAIGVRHPLDQIVSFHAKLKTNHKGAFEDPAPQPSPIANGSRLFCCATLCRATGVVPGTNALVATSATANARPRTILQQAGSPRNVAVAPLTSVFFPLPRWPRMREDRVGPAHYCAGVKGVQASPKQLRSRGRGGARGRRPAPHLVRDALPHWRTALGTTLCATPSRV